MLTNRSRAALGAALLLLACNSDPEPPRGARSGDAGPGVRVNGFRIDVGEEPSVPLELDASADDVVAGAGLAGRNVKVLRQRVGAPGPAHRRRWIVMLAGPVREEQKGALAAAGARLGGYLPDHAFHATMDDDARGRVERLGFVRGVVRYKPAYKIDPALRAADGTIRREGGPARLELRAESEEGLGEALSLVRRKGGKVLRAGRDVARVELDRGAIAALAQLEDVLAVAEAPQPRVLNDTSRWVIQSNATGLTPIWDEGLHGEGQIVGIGDTGLDHDMCWFRDPAGTAIGPAHRKVVGYTTWVDDYDGDMGHGSHVAGTVAGDQTPITGQGAANGMAPAARLHMTDLTPGEQGYVYPPADLGDLFIVPYFAGARIHSNSWGAAVNSYGVMPFTTDRFLWEHKDMLVLFSNGNSGPWLYSVGSPATAKNVVSVGATMNGPDADGMANFSSHGPTGDGRLKPTLTAPGVAISSADSDGLRDSYNCSTAAYSGTSMATPTVAGAAALVRQYFVDGYWPSGLRSPADGFQPSAALVKAALVNAAQDMTGGGTDGPIPATGQGWGRVNLSNTLRFAGDARFLDVVDLTEGLATGASWTHGLHVAGDQQLKVTLVWTDYPAAEGADPALVNDLDLVVTAPGEVDYRGNVFDQGASIPGGAADRLNVEEQVLVPAPTPGSYRITVTGHNVPHGPQPFALLVSGAGGIRSAGYVALDRTRYGAATTVEVKVVDLDLDLDPSVRDEVVVSIASGTEPAGESITLQETGPSTAILVGTIPTAPAPAAPGNGALEVGPGETIVATYLDADDGTGAPATSSATAAVDLEPPLVSGVAAGDLDQASATISWTTSEPAAARVLFGETPALGALVEHRWLSLHHAVVLGGLREDVTYFYAVEAVDEAGNVARDDAGGALRTFRTPIRPPELRAYSSEGTETYQAQTIVHGTALDPSGVVSLTVNGIAASVRAADGYFEIAMPLALGGNTFTVIATDGLGSARTLNLLVTRYDLPNLVLTSVSGPGRVGVGMPVDLTTTVCNVGAGPATFSGAMSWYVSTDPVITPADDVRLAGSPVALGDPLGAGECFTFAFGQYGISERIPAETSLVGRTLYLGGFVDVDDEVWESDETDNGTASYLASVEGPDLLVTAASMPIEVGLYDSFRLDFTVANAGLGSSGFSSQSAAGFLFYLSDDAVITPSDVPLVYLGTLLPGGSVQSSFWPELRLPPGLSPGEYFLGAIADPQGAIPEADESNNVFLGNPVSVQVGADLAMTEVSATTNGGALTVRNTVTQAPTGFGAPATTVGIFLSSDPVITTADLLLGSRSTAPLSSGETSTADTVVPLPAGLAGGSYYVGAVADPWNGIRESDETNNALAGNVVTLGGADLLAVGATAPSSAVQGQVVDVTETVSADPGGTAAPPFYAGIFISPDPVIDRTDALLACRLVPGLAPGESSTATTAVTIPPTLAPGTWYVGVIADDFPVWFYDEATDTWFSVEDQVGEVDAADNAIAAGPTTILGPDLAPTAVSGPASGKTGRTITISSTVASFGTAVASSTVTFYLSTDADITTADAWVGARTVPPLASGESSTASTSVNIPAGLAPGSYHLGAITDTSNLIVESDESNNARAGTLISVQTGAPPPEE